MSSHPSPTRLLPKNPSLVQLRKQAKELLRNYRNGQKEAIAEVERFERHPDANALALNDAQRILARAYGFSSWNFLKQHVDGLNVEIFCAAVEAGNVGKVRIMAKTRPDLVDVERGGRFGESIALHFAVLNRDAKMTQTLMELGANARAGIWPHRDATTAWSLAVERGYDEIVAILQQAEESRRTEFSPRGEPAPSKTDALLHAIRTAQGELAVALLEEDLGLVHACDEMGVTPTHLAAWTQNPALIAWLLEHGAAFDAKAFCSVPVRNQKERTPTGRTPLDYAAMAVGWAADGQIHPFMENASKDRENFDETVRLLRSAGAELTVSAAVAIGDRDAVVRIHREGRFKNEIHTLRGGLLSIAVRVHDLGMVSLLLELGLDPNETVLAEGGGVKSWGMPLWFASMCGRHEIAEILLAHGADPNAIVYACGDALGNAADDRMQTLLRKHGAKITVEQLEPGEKGLADAKAILAGTLPAASLNVDNPTPTDLAEQMLWSSGNREPEIVRLCLPHMTRKLDDPWWNYVLLHAGNAKCFKMILDHGVDPNVFADGGYTILHHLASTNVRTTDRVQLAKMLLDAGASLKKRDSMLKSTPLGWACRWGRVDLVRLYLQHGADAVEPEAERWATPLAWARKGNHREILELLQAQNEARGGQE